MNKSAHHPNHAYLLPLLLVLFALAFFFVFLSSPFSPFRSINISSSLKPRITAIPTFRLYSPSTVKTLVFDIKAENDTFTPSQIEAKVGDVVRLNLIAYDKTYDLTISALNMSQSAQKGERTKLELQTVNAGSYEYVCQTCSGKTKGVLVVHE